MKLFSVFLGGRAKKCNTELHDVVFTCGQSIKDTYYDLLESGLVFLIDCILIHGLKFQLLMGIK